MHFELKDYDTSSWKQFKISSFFTFEKGYELSPNKNDVFNTNEGDLVKCLVAKNNNCGIGGYKLNPIKTWNKDGLAIIAQGDGGAGLSYYVDAPFCANKCVWVLIPKDNIYFNKYVGLFLSSLLSKYKSMFSHSNGLNFNKVKNLSIKLPVDHNGDPDWEYMENEIKNIYSWVYEEYFQEFDNFQNTNVILPNWRLFKIKDLFEVSRGKRIVKNRDYVENKDDDNVYPVVTAKTLNNAIDGYYSKYNCEGNVITCGGEATGMISFYQEDKCWVMDRSRILKPKFNNLNKYIALFLIPILNKWNCLFNYGHSANPNEINELTIKLPVDHNGDPDWEYMENYVKSLPYSKYL